MYSQIRKQRWSQWKTGRKKGSRFFIYGGFWQGIACDKHFAVSMKEGLFFEASSGRNKFYLIQKKIWFSHHQGITSREPFQITRVAKDQNPDQQQVGLECIRNIQSDVKALKSIACAAKVYYVEGISYKKGSVERSRIARHVQRNVHAYRIRKVYSIRSQWVDQFSSHGRGTSLQSPRIKKQFIL